MRSRQTRNKYREETLSTTHIMCIFCDPEQTGNQIIETGKYFKIFTNKFPYDFWDMKEVDHHIMIVPMRHVDSIAHFNGKENAEFLRMLAKFESQGYNFYGRSPGDITKSIEHQHTHLIKPTGKEIKRLVYSDKPHLLFFR